VQHKHAVNRRWNGDDVPCPRPSTGVDLTLDADQYTVAFADIEGADFIVRGCSS